MYQERFYRRYGQSKKLVDFTVVDRESDLFIRAQRDLSDQAKALVRKYRTQIADYAKAHPEFLKSLAPLDVDQDAPGIVRRMAEASRKAGVGPMAAVAGAVSEHVGSELLKHSSELMVENGGDIFLASSEESRILVYAGDSPFSEKIALLIHPEDTPLGICTSAGTIGHSLSFGRADAVVVLSKDTLLADATATALGNIVKTPDDIQRAIDFGKIIEGIEGILVIIGDKMGAWGKIELIRP